MKPGEKIKYYRNAKGLSQEQLAQLSGINLSTIKKYEADFRNPKPDQLKRIAGALGISSNLFMDIEVESVADIMTLLVAMNDNIDMDISAKKNKDGKYDPKTVSITINDEEINRRLCSYLNAIDIENDVKENIGEYESTPENRAALDGLKSTLHEIRLQVVASPFLAKKRPK